jgi:hypothetical protein
MSVPDPSVVRIHFPVFALSFASGDSLSDLYLIRGSGHLFLLAFSDEKLAQTFCERTTPPTTIVRVPDRVALRAALKKVQELRGETPNVLFNPGQGQRGFPVAYANV